MDNYSFSTIVILAVIIIAILTIVVLKIKQFLLLSREEQINNVKEWLLYAVTLAEKELGSGTGALKLRQVYDMFVSKFPLVAKFLAFNLFSEYVDEALSKMKELLEKNERVKELVEDKVESD